MCISEKESLFGPANLTRQAYQAGQPSQPKSLSSRPSSASWPNSCPSLLGTLLAPARAWAGPARNRLATATEQRDPGVIAFLLIPPCPLFQSKKGRGEAGSRDWRGRDSPCPRYHLAHQGVVPATQACFLGQSCALCLPSRTTQCRHGPCPQPPSNTTKSSWNRSWHHHSRIMPTPRA
jgi:hypothetical protein